MIHEPNFPPSHASHLRDCQRTLLSELNDLIEQATAAGWGRKEVVLALADLLEAEVTDGGELLRTMVDWLGASRSNRSTGDTACRTS